MCKRRLFRRLIRALFTSLCVALVLCEVGLRFLTATQDRPADDLTARRASGKMTQYAHSPYWSREFVYVFHDVMARRYQNDDDMQAMLDTALPGYTIANNERRTTDQPTRYSRQVWVYGSSTLWGLYSADGWTIASYLQRELNRRGIIWKVHNMGQTSALASTQLYWLKHSTIRPGDVVIFLDGATDLDTALQEVDRALLPCQAAQRVGLVLLQLWCTEASLDNRWRSDFTHYWNMIDSARSYALAHGATFVHLLQPLTVPEWTEPLSRMRRGDIVLTVSDGERFDGNHYSDAGNEDVARQIFAALFGPF